MKLRARLKIFLLLFVLFSCDDDVVSTASPGTPILQNTLNQDLAGNSGNIDEYFYNLNGGNEINDDYEYYDNLALSLQQGEIPLNFATFSCYLTKLSSSDLTLDLVTPSIEQDSSYDKHVLKTVTVSTPSYQNIPNMEWSEDNGRYIPQTQTVASDSEDFYFIQDFGADGCPDQFEDGSGDCSIDINPDFINGGESFTDAFNGIHDEGEFFLDYGIDGCADEFEDGSGGCLDFSNPDCDDDPNGDNGVTENNGIWDSDGVSSEYLYDEKNGIYDCSVCNINDPGYDGEVFEDDNGNGVWDSGDPNNDNNNGDEDDGILDTEASSYRDCDSYLTESECVDVDGDGIRDGFCEWTTYLMRSDDPDCSFSVGENDLYCRNGEYEEGEDFNDCGNDGDCDFIDEDGSQGNGEKDLLEEYTDGGIYVEGCKHYSDRAEYKVYRVSYDQEAMGEVEGQYYIDQDEWVRRDSVYSRSQLEFEHTFTQTKIRPKIWNSADEFGGLDLMTRINADCNESNSRDDAEIYVQDSSGCGDFEKFIYKPELFTDSGADQCLDINEDGLGGCLDYENHGVDGEDFIDSLNGAWDEGEAFTDINGNGVGDYYCLDAISDDWNSNFLNEEGCEFAGHSWAAEIFTDALNGLYDEGETFTDIDGDGVYDIGCPDPFEDGEGGCLAFIPSAYIEGSDPNGDNDLNNDNYDCGTDGICPCDSGYDSPDADGSEGGNGTECNGLYDIGEDFENRPSGTPGVYDTGFCDRSNQIWDPVEAHLDLEATPNGIRNATEPYQDRNCNGSYTASEMKNIDSQECMDTYGGSWIASGQGLAGENFDFCDVGNGQWDGDEVCRDGNDVCDATQIYSKAEKQYGSLLVSYSAGLESPEVFETVSNGDGIVDRWGNSYSNVIEEDSGYEITERESVDLIDSIVVVYSNPIIEKLGTEFDYDYTIAKSKWEDGGDTDYDYHIFRKSDEGYIMKLIHQSYFLPSESFASGNTVSTGGAFWFEENPEEEVFLYTVNGELRDGERYETSRIDTTPVADYLIRESYAVDAEDYAAPLRKLLGVEVNGCDIICGYDENENGFTDGVSNDVNLNGLWDTGEILTFDLNEDGQYDEGDEFIDSGAICSDCTVIEDCPSDTTFVNCFKVSKEKTTTLLGTGVEYVESNVSYFAKDFGLIRDDSEFRWNVAPGEYEELEGNFRWVMVNKSTPEPSDCSDDAGLFNIFTDGRKVLKLGEFDQINESSHPYKKTRTYGLQRIHQEGGLQ